MIYYCKYTCYSGTCIKHTVIPVHGVDFTVNDINFPVHGLNFRVHCIDFPVHGIGIQT